MVLLLLIPTLPAEATEKDSKSNRFEPFQEEVDMLEDAEFPDLLSVDDTSELMDEFELLQEEDMVVSAARHWQEIGLSPSAITIITKQDIEACGALTFSDLFRLVPGMDVVVATSSYSAITTRSYWTFENRHFLVLIDGREVNLELLGMTPWESLPISLDEVERIEIIRGPGSALYGANALFGVISITTYRIPKKISGWGKIEAGEAGMFSLSTGITTHISNAGILLNAGRDIIGMFVDPRNTTKERFRLRSRVEYPIGKSKRLVLDAGFTNAQGKILTSAGYLTGDLEYRSLGLIYEGKKLQVQAYWQQVPIQGSLDSPLQYGEVLLARIQPISVDANTWDLRLQWSLPKWLENILIIVGANGRVSWLQSDSLLDGNSFNDPTSEHFHQPGIDYWEFRAGTFFHTEITPVSEIVITAGLRVDYNTLTDLFLSPRLSLVYSPKKRHHVRIGVARSFFKPAFLQSRTHIALNFPLESPIQGTQQDAWQEYMTRVIGNEDLHNEDLWAIEAGYLGEFFDQRLKISLELYANLYREVFAYQGHLVPHPITFIDLEKSSMQYENITKGFWILGSELGLGYQVVEHLRLYASWTHRQIQDRESGAWMDSSPKNLFTVGGWFFSPQGLQTGLLAYIRSDFTQHSIQNPKGLLLPLLEIPVDIYMAILGKLGWKTKTSAQGWVETGLKVFLPLSLSDRLIFRGYDMGGGMTPIGEYYGGEELTRTFLAYLKGVF